MVFIGFLFSSGQYQHHGEDSKESAHGEADGANNKRVHSVCP